MTTANQIIRSALGKLGIVSPGETLKPGDAGDCLRSLNLLLDAWKVENLYAYAVQEFTHSLAADTQTITIGPLGTINTPARPVRFEPGSYFTVGGIDYPLEQINQAEYNDIGLKTLSGLGPSVFTYNPTLPLGVMRFYPQASAGATLHLLAQVQLAAFASLTAEYTLPPGYERALAYSLAEEVGADYEREIPPTVMKHAANGRRLIKRANIVVPQLQFGERMEGHLERFMRG